MDWVEGKQRCRPEGDGSRLEKAPPRQENRTRHRSVQTDIDCVKAPCRAAKYLITKEITQRHHGPVVIRGPPPGERPRARGEDLADMPETLYIGVLQHLNAVVVHEIIKKGVQIRQD